MNDTASLASATDASHRSLDGGRILRRRHKKRLFYIWLVAAAPMLLLTIGALAPRIHLGFDEAYNLNLVQTLAGEGVYATRLQSEYRLFDPAITSGPTVLLPLALALHVLGSSLNVVRGTLAVLFLFYLVVMFFSTKQIFDWTIAILFVSLFVTMPMVPIVGLRAQGEVPAISLTLGALALFDRANGAKQAGILRILMLCLGGILMGLAVLAKAITVIVLVIAATVMGLEIFRDRASRRSLSQLAFVGAACGVLLTWQSYQYWMMHRSAPQLLLEWERSVAVRSEILFTQVVFAPLSHFRSAWQQAFDVFGPFLLCLGLVACLVLHRSVFGWSLRSSALITPAHRIIAATTSFWLFWYFLLSGPQATNRHLLVGVVLSELIVLRFISWLWKGEPRSSISREVGATRTKPKWVEQRFRLSTRHTPVSMIGLVLVWGAVHGSIWNWDHASTSQTLRSSQFSVAAWIDDNVPHDDAISGWGWFVPWDISFLAQRTPSSVNLHTGDLQGLTDWLVITPELVVTGNMDARLRQFLSSQGPPVFVSEGYRIYKIRREPDG